MISLEQQVVSLELAKRLKELGVKQESMFWWMEIERLGGWTIQFHTDNTNFSYPPMTHKEWEGIKSISAFTVAELGEMLPHEVNVPILLANSNQLYFNNLVKIPCHKTPYWYPHSLSLNSQSSRSCAGLNIKVLKDKGLEFANSICPIFKWL